MLLGTRSHQPHWAATPNRFKTIEAGHAPKKTYNHWFTPTNAVSARNHGLTTATRNTLSKLTDPAIAKRIRSRGHFVEVLCIAFILLNTAKGVVFLMLLQTEVTKAV